MEIWKDIEGFEGLYQVSNLGNVKSLIFRNGKYRIAKEKVLKPLYDKDKYKKVTLYKNGKPKICFVHRLVAEAFIPNPNNYKLVLHKKAVSSGGNCNVENLYWGTQKENMQDKMRENHHKIIKYWLGKKGKKNPLSKKIEQYTLAGEFIKTWDSMSDIERELRLSVSNIHSVCNGKRNKCGGYHWKYAKEINNEIR